jgi:hypothetical protein
VGHESTTKITTYFNLGRDCSFRRNPFLFDCEFHPDLTHATWTDWLKGNAVSIGQCKKWMMENTPFPAVMLVFKSLQGYLVAGELRNH